MITHRKGALSEAVKLHFVMFLVNECVTNLERKKAGEMCGKVIAN